MGNRDPLLKVAHDIEQNPTEYQGDSWWDSSKTKDNAGWAMVRILLEVGEIEREDGMAVDIIMPDGTEVTYREYATALKTLTGIPVITWTVFVGASPFWTPNKTVAALRHLHEHGSLMGFDTLRDTPSEEDEEDDGE